MTLEQYTDHIVAQTRSSLLQAVLRVRGIRGGTTENITTATPIEYEA